MQEGAVVRDQQQSRGVPVQTPDRRQRRGAAAPPGRQEFVDAAAGLFVGTDHPGRLVHHQDERRWRIYGGAADGEPFRDVCSERNAGAGVRYGLAVKEDGPLTDQSVDLPPGAIAQVGQETVQANGGGRAHRRAS
jgi:hypothetical protein